MGEGLPKGSVNTMISTAAAAALLTAGLGVIGLGAAPVPATPAVFPEYHWCPGQAWNPGWGFNWNGGHCHDDFYNDGDLHDSGHWHGQGPWHP
jgi:hypothetical protein